MSQRKKKPVPKKTPARLAARSARKAQGQQALAPVPYPGTLAPPAPGLLLLDLGCGPHKKPGHLGVDQFPFPGVDHIANLGDRSTPWPFANDSVGQVHCSHFIEHLSSTDRVYFMNELFRVLAPGGTAWVVTPHWASNRAYGDFTHAWPPVSEMFYFYLNAAWREGQAPHTDLRWNPLGYSCDFDFGAGFTTHPDLVGKSDETQRFMIQFYKEAAQDMQVTLTKRIAVPTI